MTKSASQSGWRSGFVTAATWLALSALVWTWTGPAAAWAPGDDTPATAERAAEQDNPTDASAPTNGSASTDGTAPTNGSDPTDGSANAATGSQGASKPKGNSGRVLSIVALVAAIFIIPMLLGNFLSKKLRMPDHGTRISIVLFAIIASVAATLGGWPPKLGIDLGGGAILVYEVKDKSFKEMDKLVGAVLKRVNPDGLKEVNVRPYGEHEIEIIIPMADEAELARMQNIISQQGTLEFRIVADAQFREDEEIINLAKDDQFKDEKDVIDADKDGATTVVARWVPVVPDEVGSIVSQRGHPVRENKKGETEVLVLIDKQNVTGEFLTSATAGNDENAQPCVHFRFNPAGAKRFGRLTSNNLPNPIDEKQAHKLAIILDGRLHSAPFIRSRIDELGQITGRFTAEEVGRLADVLTAGSLPTTLREEPTSSMHIGATLGEDTKTKGVWSMIWSTVAVVIFMVFYYRFAGIVANLALLLNVLLIVAFMILFNAAFTLSGLAGLALTVGMAVDANVLIYERMREEISRGATLRMAIRNGFERATTTIVDANVTTLISAVVLWFIGTDQVKGFAVTLILGIVMNLFTAITFTRLIFDIAEKHRWIKQLKMLRVMEKPNFDFIGKRKLAISFSLLLIGAGLVGVFLRGRGLLDIDFTGGVSVQVLFEKKQEIGYIRDRVNDLPDVTVQSVDLGDEEKGHRFLIVTSMSEIDESNPPPSGPKTNITLVERTLKDVFNDADHRLAFNHLTWSGLAPHGGLKPATEAKPPDDANPPEADGADAGRAGGVSPLLVAALDPEADAGRAGGVSPLLVTALDPEADARRAGGVSPLLVAALAPEADAGRAGGVSPLLVTALDPEADARRAGGVSPLLVAALDPEADTGRAGGVSPLLVAALAPEADTGRAGGVSPLLVAALDPEADAGRAGGVSPMLAAALDPEADAGRAGDVSPLLVAALDPEADAGRAGGVSPLLVTALDPEADAGRAGGVSPLLVTALDPEADAGRAGGVSPLLLTALDPEADAGRAGGVSPLLAAALDPDADAGRAGDVSPLLVAAGSNQDDAATIDESPLEKTKPANQAGSPATKKAGAKRDLYAGGTVVTLTFADGDPDDATTKPTQVNHDTLSGEIKRALVAGGFSENVAFKLDNPEYEAGSDKRFAQWTLTIGLTGEPTESLLKEIKRKLAQEPFFPSSNRVGASVAFNTQAQATFALLASLVMIVLYVWIRFQQVSFGFAAVLALVHDVLVALGALALSYWLANLPFMDKLLIEPFKINLPIIAAFLTIIGYSINDTIVIFDRIREIRGKSPELGPDLVNRCVNETLSRTLLTSLTVFIVVLILYIFGGLGIHGFAFTLVIGTISGTYSTVYIATPVLIWMNKSKVRGGGAAGGSMAKPKPPVPSATGS